MEHEEDASDTTVAPWEARCIGRLIGIDHTREDGCVNVR